MREFVKEFVKNAKAIALADTKKRLKGHSIQSVFSSKDSNSIFNQQKLIELIAKDFERIDLASAQLEIARKHLVSALASLEGFNELSKRELLLAANFTHGYIYMLNEFIEQKQRNMAKPVTYVMGLHEHDLEFCEVLNAH